MKLLEQCAALECLTCNIAPPYDDSLTREAVATKLVLLACQSDAHYGKPQATPKLGLSTNGITSIDGIGGLGAMVATIEVNGQGEDVEWCLPANIDANPGHNMNVAFGSHHHGPPLAILAPAPCPFAPPTWRKHLLELCCICSQPHTVDKCWHVEGIPKDREEHCQGLLSLKQRGEGPFSRSALGKPPYKPKVAIGNVDAGNEFADSQVAEDSDEARELMALQEQAYWSPLVCKAHNAIIFGHIGMISTDNASVTINNGDDATDGMSMWLLSIEQGETDGTVEDLDLALPEDSLLVPEQGLLQATCGFMWTRAQLDLVHSQHLTCLNVYLLKATVEWQRRARQVPLWQLGQHGSKLVWEALISWTSNRPVYLLSQVFIIGVSSLHGLWRCGFEADHRMWMDGCYLWMDGHYLWIQRVGDKKEYLFPLTQAHGTDFVVV